MKPAIFALTLALPIALVGCQNEPEEAPDITEAIPLDDDGADASSGDASDDDLDPSGAQGSPFTDEADGESSATQSEPSEGANIYGGEDEGALGASGSKLQPADPPS